LVCHHRVRRWQGAVLSHAVLAVRLWLR